MSSKNIVAAVVLLGGSLCLLVQVLADQELSSARERDASAEMREHDAAMNFVSNAKDMADPQAVECLRETASAPATRPSK
jgi:hypothetical protein